ncbi:MAG: MFS transporter [Gammaproteobacteria bacterium]|nr:MFS transporter [Gammaproteobacteria bacterium]
MSTAIPSARVDARALKSIALQFWLNGAVFAAFVPRLPEVRDMLGITIDQLGQALTLASVGGLVGSLTIGKVIKRLQLKPTMLISACLICLLMPWLAFSTAMWQLVALLSLMMMLDVFVDVSMNIQASDLSARQKTPVINRLHGLWSIGTVAGSISAGVALSAGISLQMHLLLISGALAFAMVYIASGLKQPVLLDEQTSQSTQKTPPHYTKYLMFLILGVCCILPEILPTDWAAFRLHDDLGEANNLAALGYTTFATGMVIGRMSGDHVVSKVGAYQALIYGCVFSLVGLTLAFLIDTTDASYAGLALAGLGASVFFPSIYDAAARANGNSASMLGAMTAGSRVAVLVAPAAIGWLAYQPSLNVGMAVALFAMPAVLLLAWLSKPVFSLQTIESD